MALTKNSAAALLHLAASRTSTVFFLLVRRAVAAFLDAFDLQMSFIRPEVD